LRQAGHRWTPIHQLTRISYEKGSLKHDDRLDALSIAVAFHVENMAQDAERGISFEKQARLNKELGKFIANAVGPGRAKRMQDMGSHRFAQGKTGARPI
jgi:hypothetical protein